jgi:hypothetical protein
VKPGDVVVFNLVQAADRARSDDAEHVHDHRSTPGEVPPGEVAVAVDGVRHIYEALRRVLTKIKRVAALSEGCSQLANRVRDVALLVRSPSSGEPDELVGTIPIVGTHEATVRLGHRHGEAEAVVLPDLACRRERIDDTVELLDELAHEDVRAVLAHVDSVCGKVTDVQCCGAHGTPRYSYLEKRDIDGVII